MDHGSKQWTQRCKIQAGFPPILPLLAPPTTAWWVSCRWFLASASEPRSLHTWVVFLPLKREGTAFRTCFFYICFPPVMYCILITDFILHSSILRANRDLIKQSNREGEKNKKRSYVFFWLSGDFCNEHLSRYSAVKNCFLIWQKKSFPSADEKCGTFPELGKCT